MDGNECNKQTDDRERRDLRPSIGPGSEFEKTRLNVQREIFNVNVTGGFVGGRRKPGDQAVVMNDGFGVHPQLVVTVGTGCVQRRQQQRRKEMFGHFGYVFFVLPSQSWHNDTYREKKKRETGRKKEIDEKRERKRRRRRAIVSLRETPSLTRLFLGGRRVCSC